MVASYVLPEIMSEALALHVECNEAWSERLHFKRRNVSPLSVEVTVRQMWSSHLHSVHILSAGKIIMHDPFAMRPFFGYNFGQYLSHWLSMAHRPAAKLPKIFHVNWFRKDKEGRFLWPGYGENSRVLEWMFKRIQGEDCARLTAIGHIPDDTGLNLKGLEGIRMQELFDVSKEFWEKELEEIKRYFEEQVNADLPYEMERELLLLEKRIKQL